MSLYGAIRRERTTAPQPPPPGHGQLDSVKPPRRPDVTVFGGWHPCGTIPPYVQHACRCGCCQPDAGPCWNCGLIVTPGQWL